MYVQQWFERPQLPLFDAFLAGTSSEPRLATNDISRSEDNQAFSELALRGAAGHCADSTLTRTPIPRASGQ